MTSIFDRWTDLDPALALRRIEAAHGSQVFDSYAYLDPQRALIQIEDAFGIELDDVNGLLDPSTLEDAIDTAIEAEGGYVAKAVNLSGAAVFKRAGALVGVTDSPLGLMSAWIKSADFFDLLGANSGALIVGPNFDLTIDTNGVSTVNTAHFAFYNVANDASLSKRMLAGWDVDVWVHILAAWDTNHAGIGQKIFQLYLNDIAYTNFETSESAAAFSVDYANPFWSAGAGTNDVTGPIGDEADYYFAPGQYLDLSVEANRRKFIDAAGKPVDLGTDGSTPTGTAPAIFFSGDHTDYATNKGTGGAFVLTGTLTNATTSPSD